MNFYKGRDMYISDMIEAVKKGSYNKMYTYIKEHIHD